MKNAQMAKSNLFRLLKDRQPGNITIGRVEESIWFPLKSILGPSFLLYLFARVLSHQVERHTPLQVLLRNSLNQSKFWSLGDAAF